MPALPAASVDALVEATMVVSVDMIEDADVIDANDLNALTAFAPLLAKAHRC